MGRFDKRGSVSEALSKERLSKGTSLLAVYCLVSSIFSLGMTGNQVGEAKAPDSLPTVDQVLDKYIKAIGGKDAVERVATRVTKGTLTMGQLEPASVQLYQKAPDKFLSVFPAHDDVMGTFVDTLTAFNGTAGWAKNPDGEVTELSGEGLAMAKRKFDLHREIKLKALYPKMALKGKEKVGNRDAYVIEATPTQGDTEKFYFDTETGLLLRHGEQWDTPEGRKEYLMQDYDDYEDVDGVRLPFIVHDPFSTMKITEVKHNIPIDDTKFERPEAR